LTVSYRVIDADSGELRATGETRHAFLDRNFKPSPLQRSHPGVDALMTGLANLLPTPLS
jgi:acyl-CoA thioester hydrolase